MHDQNDPNLESDPPLDLSSKLSAEEQAQVDEERAQLRALMAMSDKEFKNVMYRKGTHTDPVPNLVSVEGLINFVNQTRRMPIEKIEAKLVNDTMPVMVWKLREFALTGDYTSARAIEIWMNWAAKILSRPKRQTRDPGTQSGALFDARLTKGQVIEAEAVKKKGHFGSAGDFIGKKPPKGKKKPASPSQRGEPSAD
jgi:hypothetical protein